jgi:hypothetical protein
VEFALDQWMMLLGTPMPSSKRRIDTHPWRSALSATVLS